VSEYLEIAKNVIKMESDAIAKMESRITEEQILALVNIFTSLVSSRGTLVFCGVGKSGIIAKKLASTFSSLGLRSQTLHPTEALHGDLGNTNPEDAICFLSKSGTTEEILKLIPYLNIAKNNCIGLLGNVNSPIATKCNIAFDCSVETEACLNNLAPTASSTAALAMGDAMAVVYEKVVGLSKEHFAINHPAGFLGKSLKLKVTDLMLKVEDCPTLQKDSSFQDLILAMTNKNIGACAIINNNKQLEGIIVEGDIRKTFAKGVRSFDITCEEIMTKKPITITPDVLAIDALKTMEMRESQINILPVIKEDNEFLGIIRSHDLIRVGLSNKSY
jgi:arabinose-5-phosphate isomerase